MNKKEIFWGLIRKQIPIIIFFAVISGIFGTYASYMNAKAKAITRKIKKDNESLNKWMKDMVRTSPNKMSFKEFENGGKKPIDPTVIYVYD